MLFDIASTLSMQYQLKEHKKVVSNMTSILVNIFSKFWVHLDKPASARMCIINNLPDHHQAQELLSIKVFNRWAIMTILVAFDSVTLSNTLCMYSVDLSRTKYPVNVDIKI